MADLAYKTKRLIEERATQEKGPDEGKVFNLVRGLQQEMDENTEIAPVLQPLRARRRESRAACFPNAAVNDDEERRFRAALYKPLLSLSKEERARRCAGSGDRAPRRAR